LSNNYPWRKVCRHPGTTKPGFWDRLEPKTLAAIETWGLPVFIVTGQVKLVSPQLKFWENLFYLEIRAHFLRPQSETPQKTGLSAPIPQRQHPTLAGFPLLSLAH
jgi:hypothetical protein